MLEFKKKILFVGYGAVAECTLPILFKHIKVPAKNVTVMDFENRAEKLKKWTAKGVRFVRNRVTEENQRELFQSQAPQVEDGLYLVPKVIE
jgi:homospermidine synthase